MNASLELILILFILHFQVASSESWLGYVKTTNDLWSIYRQSENISFESEQHIEGKIEPFSGPRGRVLNPYCSNFEDMNLNEVVLKERTAGLEGNYSSFESIEANSKVNPPIGLEIGRNGSFYDIDFSENWPVSMIVYRTLEYSGKGINDRDFSGNNLDFVGTDLLYNKELSKSLVLEMRLDRMNATVLATDNEIIQAERKATRDLNFKLSAHTTGIADLKYQQSGTKLDRKSMTGYEVLNGGYERYSGSFNLTKDIRMKSKFDEVEMHEDWLPCCFQGWKDMNPVDKRSHSADGIFNCTCFNPGDEP